jgi:hypothetical protein
LRNLSLHRIFSKFEGIMATHAIMATHVIMPHGAAPNYNARAV